MIRYNKSSKEKKKKTNKIGFIMIFATPESKIDIIRLNLQVPNTLPRMIQ